LLYTLYSSVGVVLALVSLPLFVLYCLITKKTFVSIQQRFGFFDSDQFNWQHKTRVWLHAASVGEVQVAKALITELKKTDLRADIIVSTMTEQGQVIANQQLGNQVVCLYAPLDLPWIVKRFIRVIRPTIYVCLETELWPNMLRIAHTQGVKSLLLNGRLSDRSFSHYKFLAGFMKQVLSHLSSAATISSNDKLKYVALGLPPEKIIVCGNAKYDLDNYFSRQNSNLPKETFDGKDIRGIIHNLGIRQGQKVLVAGSTHNGEEEALLQAHLALRIKFPDLITIIAPRHLNRLAGVEAILKAQSLKYQKLSEIRGSKRTAEIVLVDFMGALANLYSVASFAFCGGSLVDRGGHNIMEAAIWGVPPFYGPHMKDFSDAAQIFNKKKAGFQIDSANELIEKIIYFNAHHNEYILAGKAAKDIAQSQQGAAHRQVKLILQNLIPQD